MWVPLKEKEKKKMQSIIWVEKRIQADGSFLFFSFFFLSYFILRFSSFCPSEFVGINTESALRDEGYA